ncbi:hypothetical protein [uncultured Streptomyces sp.]|uniref:hypothetical protein n=1 Tax=uncultured Streptomyces sp. TaxID=174707 RepID=UPI0026032151|nr:hypothetical protein [uncultured Streptomyces sp.]
MPPDLTPGSPPGLREHLTEAERHERILHVLDRLLHDKTARTAFVEGGPSHPQLALDADLITAFERVDVRELVLVGRNIRSKVVSGGTGTGLGLGRIFSRSLEAVRDRTGRTPNEVAELFVASPQFQDFRDVPFSQAGRGRLLPECFHRFVSASPVFGPGGELGEAAEVEPLVHHEAAVAVAQAIATGAGATFDVGLTGSSVHGGVVCTFRDYAEAPAAWDLVPTMYLAAPGRCVVGRGSRAVFDALVAVLAGEDSGLTPQVRESLGDRLRTWGLR